MRVSIILYSALLIFGCQKEVTRPDFNGTWVAKEILFEGKIKPELMEKNDIYLPILVLDTNKVKSIRLVFSADSAIDVEAFIKYDSFNAKVNNERESTIIYDYKGDDMFFLDKSKKRYYHYLKYNSEVLGLEEAKKLLK